MAVYYKWIKGCSVGASLDSGLWTYLKWGSGEVGTSVDNLPHIYTYTGKKDNPKTENDLGYILTNKATNISLEADWKFNNNHSLSFYDNSTTPVEQARFYCEGSKFYLLNNKDWIIKDNSSKTTMMSFSGGENKNIQIDCLLDIKDTIKVESTSELKGQVIIEKDVTIKDTTTTTSKDTGALKVYGGIGVGGAIYSGDSCTAVFFNATSDKRAKENIQLAAYSALELIKKLPVYIYNYKNNSETVTGILAQDLLEAQPKELDLVSNTHATGENNDYMSIKHDKLMFVLLKAIQEQQKQIEQLKAEIEFLKTI